MRLRLSWTGGTLLLMLTLPWAYAAAQEQPVFSTNSELVVLHVTVKDKHGGLVTGLSRDAFRVFEDGEAQAVRFSADQEAPVTVGLLIDSSGSMRMKRDLVIAATLAFAEESHPEDELFALVFNEQVHTVLPAEEPFTNNVSLLSEALTRSISVRGRTALFEALVAGLDYAGRGNTGRKALVGVGDGGDNASQVTFQDVLMRTRASDVVIYTVALVDPGDPDKNPQLLKKVAAASGGEAFEPGDLRGVSDVLKHIARDIRNTYTIGYVPTNRARDGRFRRVRVRIDSTGGSALVVHTRAGYVAF